MIAIIAQTKETIDTKKRQIEIYQEEVNNGLQSLAFRVKAIEELRINVRVMERELIDLEKIKEGPDKGNPCCSPLVSSHVDNGCKLPGYTAKNPYQY